MKDTKKKQKTKQILKNGNHFTICFPFDQYFSNLTRLLVDSTFTLKVKARTEKRKERDKNKTEINV